MVSPIMQSPTLAAPALAPPGLRRSTLRTIWGLDPFPLHSRFWAAHGVQVVRQGEP
jgi:hypothetical protein